MMIRRLLNHTHKRARHKGFGIIGNVIFSNNDKPVVERRKCTCIVLFQALIENIANMLFKDFNEPTMSLVFEELAGVPSDMVETMGRHAFAAVALTEGGRVVTWGSTW